MKVFKTTPLYKKYVSKSRHSVVVQIGGRFSGKSHNEQLRLVANLGSKKDYKLLVIENLETGMADGFYAGLRDRITEFEHEPAYNDRSRTAYIKNTINQNEAIFRGYTSDVQKLNVKRISGVTEILVEEGEWMSYDDFISLYQQLRGGNEEDRKLTVLMNPVNPDCFANQYLIETPPDLVYEYFDDGRPKVFERHMKVTYRENGEDKHEIINILVVLSTHYDNPHLTGLQRASIEQYRDTDPDKYAQLGECKFIRPQGTYFKEFSYGVHVVEPFVFPSNYRIYSSLDYGLDMTAVLWFAEAPNGDVYVFKELHEPDLIISESAKRILEVNGNDDTLATYAPGDLWGRTKDTGQTIEYTFKQNGVKFTKTSNRRVEGWLAVKEALKVVNTRDIHTGEPIKTAKLKIFSTCTTLIKHLPQIQRDEKDPNDCATEPHYITHILDALRYYCVVKFKTKGIAKVSADNDVNNFKNAVTKWR